MLPFVYQVDPHTLWIKLICSKNEITKAGLYIQKQRFENFVCTEEIAFKGATKSWREIFFVFATKIGKNRTNILNYHISNYIHTLANKGKYLRIGNEIYFSRTVFVRPSLL